MNADVADAVTEAFTAQFDIDISLYRASSEVVLQRVLQKQSAGFAGNDLVETNAPKLFALNEEGTLAEYAGEHRDFVPEEAGQFEAGRRPGSTSSPPAGTPTSCPRARSLHRGRTSLTRPWTTGWPWRSGTTTGYLTLYNYWLENGKSEDEVDQLFADMADGAKVVKGHSVQAELMSAGEFPVTASNYTYIVQTAKDRWRAEYEELLANAEDISD